MDSISTFLTHVQPIHEAVHQIKDKSARQSSSDAQSYINYMNFSYVYSAVICQYVLAFIRPLTVQLQSVTCDLLKAHEEAQNLITVLAGICSDGQHEKAVSIAMMINIEPAKPHSTGRQEHRSNVPSGSVEEYYKLNFFYPFLDHVVSHMKQRFPSKLGNAMLGAYLTPKHLHELTDELQEKLYVQLEDELPFPSEFNQEVLRWKSKWGIHTIYMII